MGAVKWKREHSKSISGRSVVILTDNDPPADEDGKPHYKGQKHAATIASDLLRVGCTVRIVEVPTGKDVSDWLCTGGTIEELRALVTGQPELTGEALVAWRARWELASDEPHKLAPSAPTSSGSLTTRCLSDIAAK